MVGKAETQQCQPPFAKKTNFILKGTNVNQTKFFNLGWENLVNIEFLRNF